MRYAVALAALIAASAASADQHTVYFGFDSAALDGAAREVVAAAVADYRANGETSVSVVGHTDTSGPIDYNIALSERRADAVAQALMAEGVPGDSVVRAWRGEAEPAVATGDGVRSRLNRRAEISTGGFTPAPAAMMDDGFDRFRIGLAPYVGVNMQDNDESVFLGVNLSANYWVTERIALSAEQAVFYNLDAKDEGVGSRSALGADLRLGDFGGLKPYIGANAGYMMIDGSGTGGFFYGPEVGFDIFGVRARVAYDIVEDRDAEDGVVSVTLGYGLNF